MKINTQYQLVSPKWRNYQKYLQSILYHAQEVLKDPRLNQSFSLIFIDDTEMHEMNLMYRHIDRPTDVLTFIDEDEPDYLGDIFVNVDALERQAIEYNHSKKREYCFLITHGLLHLLGYDHQTKEQEQEMFDYQERILENFAPRHQQI